MTNKEIQNAYVGDTQVEKIYLGADVVYEEQPTGHTVYAVLNGTESVELLETVTGQMYEMVIAEPIYTSLTLYDNDQVVTADGLVYVIDGIEYNEENVEILGISADNYATGAVLTGISYDVLNNSVYLVFQM